MPFASGLGTGRSPVLTHSRMEGSEYGTETDEDDGMVLVGRPSRS